MKCPDCKKAELMQDLFCHPEGDVWFCTECGYEEGEECAYPDCGCPEARLCVAGNPNSAAISLNKPIKKKKK